jgi:hypothetical protein
MTAAVFFSLSFSAPTTSRHQASIAIALIASSNAPWGGRRNDEWPKPSFVFQPGDALSDEEKARLLPEVSTVPLTPSCQKLIAPRASWLETAALTVVPH